ncbi:MAG: AmmeMemoRadiSam system protein B [Balneolaceae bacterium]
MELEYERSKLHQPVTAGHSYPSEASELQKYLDDAFKKYEQTEPVVKAKALYAPHIDTTVGLSSYVKAFSAIKHIKPKRVVILATSHYSGLFGELYDESPFIVVDKTFAMPNGDISTDKESISLLKQIASRKNIGVSFQDRAHRIEHSIELHLLFLNYIWNHNFKIVPILVGGFDELLYMDDSYRAEQVNEFSKLLKKEFGDDENTFFLISGDLSHFGRKFGDDKSAQELLNSVQEFDHKFMHEAVINNAEGLRSLLKTDFDATRICGFPPLQTFLHTLPNLKGTQLSYDIWDETERESAVSFGSILYT